MEPREDGREGSEADSGGVRDAFWENRGGKAGGGKRERCGDSEGGEMGVECVHEIRRSEYGRPGSFSELLVGGGM